MLVRYSLHFLMKTCIFLQPVFFYSENARLLSCTFQGCGPYNIFLNKYFVIECRLSHGTDVTHPLCQRPVFSTAKIDSSVTTPDKKLNKGMIRILLAQLHHISTTTLADSKRSSDLLTNEMPSAMCVARIPFIRIAERSLETRLSLEKIVVFGIFT